MQQVVALKLTALPAVTLQYCADYGEWHQLLHGGNIFFSPLCSSDKATKEACFLVFFRVLFSPLSLCER